MTAGDPPRLVRLLVTADAGAGFQLTAAPPLADVAPGETYVTECWPQWAVAIGHVRVRHFKLERLMMGDRDVPLRLIDGGIDPDWNYRVDPPVEIRPGESVSLHLRNDGDVPRKPKDAVIVLEPAGRFTGRPEDAVACPACDHPPGVSCDGPMSHPARRNAYECANAAWIVRHDIPTNPGVRPSGTTDFWMGDTPTERPQRVAYKPERVSIKVPAEASPDWTIGHVSVENRCGFCGKSFKVGEKHVCAEAAISADQKTFLTTVGAPKPPPDPNLHHPRITRTMREGPGNRTDIRGCACGADAHSIEAYATHVGWPVEAVRALLALYGIALDWAHYGQHPHLSDSLPSHEMIARKIDEWLTVRGPANLPPSPAATEVAAGRFAREVARARAGATTRSPYAIVGNSVVGPNLQISLAHVIELLGMRNNADGRPRELPTPATMDAIGDLVLLLNDAHHQGRLTERRTSK